MQVPAEFAMLLRGDVPETSNGAELLVMVVESFVAFGRLYLGEGGASIARRAAPRVQLIDFYR